jgi:uncharacterized phage protein gp47/JayE
MTYGLLSTGFTPKPYAQILAEFQDFYTSLYGNPNLDPKSRIGRRIATQSKILADLWALMQLVYNAPFIALTDEGSIDNTMANEGTSRLPATPTIIWKAICAFSDADTITAGSLIQNSEGKQFAAASNIVAEGAGNVTGEFICTETGPNAVPLGDTLSILTPSVEGHWSGVTLSTDADAVAIGQDIETLAAARLRYADSNGILGAGTIPSLQANLNNISGVTAKVLENTTMVDNTGTGGLPPKSIYVLCKGTQSDDEKAAIAAVIWAKRGGGIQTYGSVPVTVVDANGDNQIVNFDYVENLEVAAVVSYSLFDEETAPADIHAAITAALTALFLTYKPGEDVLYGRVIGVLYQIQGIKSIALTLNGGTTDISVSIAQVAALSTVTFS